MKETIGVYSDNPRILQMVRHLFAPYANYTTPSIFFCKDEAELRIDAKNQECLIIHGEFHRRIDLSESDCYICVGALIDRLIRAFSVQSPWMLYHASVVCNQEGKCNIFLGGTHSGKTTTCVYLCYSIPGLQYISEDICMINVHTGEIIPYPKEVNLRMDALDVLRKNGVNCRNVEKVTFGDYQRFRCEMPVQHDVKNFYSAHKVYVLSRNARTNAAVKVDLKDSYTAWLQNSYSSSNIENNIVSALFISRQMPVYILEYADLQYVRDITQKDLSLF